MCIWVPYRGSMLRRYPYTHYSPHVYYAPGTNCILYSTLLSMKIARAPEGVKDISPLSGGVGKQNLSQRMQQLLYFCAFWLDGFFVSSI